MNREMLMLVDAISREKNVERDVVFGAVESALAQAIGYSLTRWRALTRYCDDGRIEMDNNAAERALRGVALGRGNYLFMGSDAGGERAAAIYSLVQTAKLNVELTHFRGRLPV